MKMRRRELLALGTSALFVGMGTQSLASEIVLSLRNPKIDGAHGEMHFSLDALRAMEQHAFRTGNQYIDNVAEFRGPLAHQVVDMIGRAGVTGARMTANNDYFTEIEIDELEKFNAILAIEMDGKPLSRREKGPIWLMYPIDGYPELQDSAYNNRLIWQLRTIELF